MKRVLAIGLLLLAACDRNEGEQQPTVAATPAALTYDGGDYTTEAQKVAHGKRLATLLDCTGCHGANLQGSDLGNAEEGAMWAPNVTLLLAKYDDAALDKLIRQGIPHDGREFWFMPVESYQFLSDQDVAAITAYLRTFKPAGKQTPAFAKNKAFQKEVERGLIGNSKAQIAKFRNQQPATLGPQHAFGRYIAQTTCTACHNNALQGWEDFTPSLDTAGAYSKEELTRLLTTGEGKVKKDLGMMSGIARNSFSKLTSRERDAVADYVIAHANRQQAPQ